MFDLQLTGGRRGGDCQEGPVEGIAPMGLGAGRAKALLEDPEFPGIAGRNRDTHSRHIQPVCSARIPGHVRDPRRGWATAAALCPMIQVSFLLPASAEGLVELYDAEHFTQPDLR